HCSALGQFTRSSYLRVPFLSIKEPLKSAKADPQPAGRRALAEPSSLELGDQTTLEFRNRGEDGEQQPAGGRRRVNVLREAGATDALMLPALKRPEAMEG